MLETQKTPVDSKGRGVDGRYQPEGRNALLFRLDASSSKSFDLCDRSWWHMLVADYALTTDTLRSDTERPRARSFAVMRLVL